jgi:hypothetical protein
MTSGVMSATMRRRLAAMTCGVIDPGHHGAETAPDTAAM